MSISAIRNCDYNLLLIPKLSEDSTYQVGGNVYDPNNVGSTTTAAVRDSVAAYNSAAGQQNPDYLGYPGEDIGGYPLIPGL